MAKQTIGIGSAADDGTGDPLRTGFSKVNDNFNEVYSSYTMTGKLTVGNSSVNTTVSNTGGIVTANSLATTTANNSVIQIANSSGTSNLTPTALKVGANVTLNQSSLFIGNSTVNSISNSSFIKIANSTSSANLSATSLAMGISTVNTTAVAIGSNVSVNSSAISVGNSSVNLVMTSSGFTGNIALGNLVVTGNLTVNGTVTTVNTATLDVADLNITIAKNATTEALANGAGLTVAGANATIKYISDSNNIVFSHKVEIGNSSSNGTINATNYTGTSNNTSYLGGVAAASYVQNTDSRTLSGNLVISGTYFNPVSNSILLGNSTSRWIVSANSVDISSSILIGNSTVNTTVNSSVISITNSTNSVSINSTSFTGTANNALYLGGTIASAYITNAASYVQNTDSRVLSGNLNFTAANVQFDNGLKIVGNTQLTLGTHVDGSNGYTYLPNGLLLNWGQVEANTSAGNVTFTAAYTTNSWSVTATANDTAITAAVISHNGTTAEIRVNSNALRTVHWIAIGS